MKCLATFSLWGNKPVYNVGAVKQARLYREWGWDTIFYVGRSVPESTIDALASENAVVISRNEDPEDQTATFWRFGAFQWGADKYDAIFSRDVDSRLSKREKMAITEFLDSSKTFHIIRDFPYHGVPILAGLFGAKKPLFPFLKENLPSLPPKTFWVSVFNSPWQGLTNSDIKNDFYQVDQTWLRFHIYEEVKPYVFAHDCYFGFERKRERQLLPARDPGDFIGKGFDENDQPRYPDHDELLELWPKKTRESSGRG